MARLSFALLGVPRMEVDGEPINLETRKATALLAYLALSGQRQGRDALVALFWPESDRTRGRSALRRTLSPLKSALGGRWLEADNETVFLRTDGDFQVDVTEFHRLAISPRKHEHASGQLCDGCLAGLEGAAALYHDDFMVGFTLADCPEFDNWQTYQRERLRRQMAETLTQLIQEHVLRRQYGRAIDYAQHWLALDPLHEPAHRQMMLLYVWSGDRTAALRQYEECVRLLQVELDVPPMEETQQIYCSIAEGQHPPPPEVPAVAPIPVAARQRLPSPVDYLPARLTSFVGRAEEMQVVSRLLAQTRLVTLTGPGGCGKTSLAVETARAILQEEGRGNEVRLIELLPVADPALLAQTLVTALELEGSPEEEARQTLIRFLARRRMLLILDNCEHVVGAAARLVEVLLRSCPSLCILATSRERLNITAETVYPVQPLALPDISAAPRMSVARAAEYPAVQLFVERCRAVRPSFRLGERNLAAVLKICSLLDGMPLALELGAAAMATFTAAEIAEQLDDRLLAAGADYWTADPRHHSLGDTVEWSYTLLNPGEQRVLVHLAVFVGGWTLEAMQEVVSAGMECVSLLQQLVRKSLVRAVPVTLPDGRRMRYHLLRAVREYAGLRLAAGDEDEDVRRRHFAYYAQLATQLGDQVMGLQHHRALAGLDADYHNIRAAVQFALPRPDLADDRLRMAAALTYYWRLRSYTLRAEGLTWLAAPQMTCSPAALALTYGARLSLGCIDPLHATLNVGAEWHDIRQWVAAGEALLAHTDLAQTDARSAGRLLLGLADAHRFPGGLARCRDYAARAVELLQAADDRRSLGFAHNILTWLDLIEDDSPAMQARQEANLQIAQASGSTWALCEAYCAQVMVAGAANDRINQVHYLKLMLALAEQEGYLSFLYLSFHWLERIDVRLAVRMAEELVARQRRQEGSIVLGLALHQLGRIYVNTRRCEQAAAVLDEAIDFWRGTTGEQGPASALQWSLAERASAAFCMGDFAAARLCCDESLALFVHAPFADGSLWPHYYRGYTALATDDLDGAADDFCECIRIVAEGYPGWEKLAVWSLAGLGEVAYRRGQRQLAGMLFGASAALDTTLPEPAARALSGEVSGYLRAMAAAGEYRQEPVVEEGWRAGASLSLAEVRALVLEQGRAEDSAPGSSHQNAVRRF